MENNNTSSDMVREGETLRLKRTSKATGEEQRRFLSNSSLYDVDRRKPLGCQSADVADCGRKSLRFTKMKKFGTWNVRGMNIGKLDIVKNEMQRLNIDLLGVSELHWIGDGHFTSDEFTVYYSGHDSFRRNGVAFIASKETARAVHGFRAINDRVMAIRINGKPRTITIIQVYAPTTDAVKAEIESFYADIQKVIDITPKRDIILVIGDLNAKIGAQEEPQITGKFGLGERNEAGDRLVEFCQENHLVVMNSWFRQPKRRLYTWTSPNGVHRNQIDYVLCDQRWRSSILSTKTFPGADCGSDHQLLVAKIKLRLGRMGQPSLAQKFDTDNIPPIYAVEISNQLALLDTAEKEPNELWLEIRDTITESAKRFVPYKKSTRRAKWMSAATIEIAERRRTSKAAGDQDEFRWLNAEFQREARKDKERYWNEQCEEMEEASKHGHVRRFYAHVKQARASFTPRKTPNIKDHTGRELQEPEEIKKRWREYTMNLYGGNRESQHQTQEILTEWEPDILEEEVVWALEQLSSRKAPGIDNIPAELLKPVPTPVLTALCQKIWNTKMWPRDWVRSVFVPLLKKGDARECSSHRTIALIPHASKILLKIIQNRIATIIERELPEVQAGFRKGRGTRDQIANLRWIMEKSREYQKEICLCFIDYTKAFDCVKHDRLWHCLQQMGVPAHIKQLIRSLYENQEATVRTPFGDTEWFEIGRGVRQGCILSPALFNMYAEMVMRKCNWDKSEIGVKIGGQIINNLRYADDTTLLAESEKDLEQLILRVKEESEVMGLYLNIKKTKVMTTADNGTLKIKINNEEIEPVQDFIFLGSKINRGGFSGPEIKRRITLGRSAMLGMEKIWKSKDITILTKCRLVNAIVFPIMTYGCETWTLKKADRRKIDSFELWCWRRMLRIPWTAMIKNKTILDSIMPKISLEGKITRQRLSYFGHIMRANTFETSIMLGVGTGSRRRGHQRTRWLDTIKVDTNMNMEQLKEAVGNRRTWRSFIHKVSESRQRLNG